MKDLVAQAPDIWQLDACGVTRTGRTIPFLLHRSAHRTTTHQRKVILIGGLSGLSEDVELALQALKTYSTGSAQLLARVELSAAPCCNPDGLASGTVPSEQARDNSASENGADRNPSIEYPPKGGFFYAPIGVVQN